MSACVSVCVARTVSASPGLSVPTRREVGLVVGSVTSMFVRVTLPEFVTRNEKSTMSPAETRPSPSMSRGVACDLSIVTAGACSNGMVFVAVGVFVGFWVVGIGTGVFGVVWPGGGVGVGPVPVAVATFTLRPASMSSWVSVYVAVAEPSAPGASVPIGIEFVERPGIGSLITTLSIVTLPVLVTVKVYVMTSPAEAPGAPLSVVTAPSFCTIRLGCCS